MLNFGGVVYGTTIVQKGFCYNHQPRNLLLKTSICISKNPLGCQVCHQWVHPMYFLGKRTPGVSELQSKPHSYSQQPTSTSHNSEPHPPHQQKTHGFLCCLLCVFFPVFFLKGHHLFPIRFWQHQSWNPVTCSNRVAKLHPKILQLFFEALRHRLAR